MVELIFLITIIIFAIYFFYVESYLVRLFNKPSKQVPDIRTSYIKMLDVYNSCNTSAQFNSAERMLYVLWPQMYPDDDTYIHLLIDHSWEVYIDIYYPLSK